HVVGDILRRATEKTGIGGVKHVPVLQEVAKYCSQIVDLDVAVDVGGGEADRAAAHRLGDDPEVLQRHDGVLAGGGVADGARPSVGEFDGEGAVARPPDQLYAEPLGHPRDEAGPQGGTDGG